MRCDTVIGKRVCVVGGAGFLGSHLVNHLLSLRCRVTVVDNLCVGKREFINEEAEFFHHDITGSEEYLRTLFISKEIEYVFNYAAWPYIPDSFARPMQVFSVNAMGAIKVINAAAEAGCRAILQVSSAELYGGPDVIMTTNGERSGGVPKLTEESEVYPHSTYGAAKAAVDYYCQSAWKERKTPVIALRQFNCVGERETHPYVVPEIIGQLSKSETILLGNDTWRDFLYAGDAVRMATELIEKGEFGQVYNLGSTSSVRIYDLAALVGDVMGKRCIIQKDLARMRPWEIWSLCSDNTKIYGVIESRPAVTLKQALHRTVEDYMLSGKKWCWEN